MWNEEIRVQLRLKDVNAAFFQQSTFLHLPYDRIWPTMWLQQCQSLLFVLSLIDLFSSGGNFTMQWTVWASPLEDALRKMPFLKAVRYVQSYRKYDDIHVLFANWLNIEYGAAAAVHTIIVCLVSIVVLCGSSAGSCNQYLSYSLVVFISSSPSLNVQYSLRAHAIRLANRFANCV